MTSPITETILPMFSSASLSDSLQVPPRALPIEKPTENPSFRPIEIPESNCSSFGCKKKSAFHRLSADMNNPGSSAETFMHIDATVIPLPYEKDENGVDCYIDKDDVFFLMCPGYPISNNLDTSSNRQQDRGLNAPMKASMKSRIASSTRSLRKSRPYLPPRPRHQPMF